METRKWSVCLQKLKIVKPGMPVLLCCKDEALEHKALHAPFSGIWCFDPDHGMEDLARALREAIRSVQESEKLPDFPVLVGKSRKIRRIREKINAVADKDITVLITGESGTGKELIARSLRKRTYCQITSLLFEPKQGTSYQDQLRGSS
ncbi:MAG: hypothetical protein B1H13_14415 [Desulfobacteraceae bacterium 4484_190.3]|nr:MAG: hypothetical protein B1H13_14415 [Desulfobacteraceae bacterium 4484_190.3]